MSIGRFFGRLKPNRDFVRGEQALQRGDYDGAVRAFETFIQGEDSWTNAWYNLGLAHKFRRDWEASARANRRAAELEPRNKPAYWNCGVAATAIRDWETARWAWRGIDLDPGDGVGPPEMNLGISPVRLTTPVDSGEVIWGTRLDPCRLRIDSVPLPEAAHRWHDVILHDVVPHGERTYDGTTWGVFDELIRMDPSDEPTFEAKVTVPTDEDLADVHARFADAALGLEDWSTIRILCKQCSESNPHEHPSPTDSTPIRLVVRRFGFAGPEANVAAELADWAAGGNGRAFGALIESRVS
jgi:tetratricopeptide (TPR) repeat protein